MLTSINMQLAKASRFIYCCGLSGTTNSDASDGKSIFDKATVLHILRRRNQAVAFQ